MASALHLLGVPMEKRTKQHLLEMVQCAIRLEHATLPPYLTAMWSIKEKTHPAHAILKTVVYEEMGHIGTMCNLLTSIGGIPAFSDKNFVPDYPTRLPCDIYPKVTPPNVIKWKVGLSRLTPAVVSDVFMIIEYPEEGPVQTIAFALEEARPKYHTIRQFYDAIADTLKYLVDNHQVHISGQKQLTEPFTGHDEDKQNVVNPITNLDEALKAIKHIKEQGEGTPTTPDTPTGHELAHYYQFKQIQVGRKFVQQNGKWSLSGDFLDFPAVYPMADIPRGGYVGQGLPKEIQEFNDKYKSMLGLLQSAWEKGGNDGQQDLQTAEFMFMDTLGSTAIALMQMPIGGNKGNYGPTFRVS